MARRVLTPEWIINVGHGMSRPYGGEAGMAMVNFGMNGAGVGMRGPYEGAGSHACPCVTTIHGATGTEVAQSGIVFPE